MACSSPFWKQKCENLKKIRLTIFKRYFIATFATVKSSKEIRRSFSARHFGQGIINISSV